jgi:hypothetical protein
MRKVKVEMSLKEAIIVKYYLDNRDMNSVEIAASELGTKKDTVFWALESLSAKIQKEKKYTRSNPFMRFLLGFLRAILIPVIIMLSISNVYHNYIGEYSGHCRAVDDKFEGRCNTVFTQLTTSLNIFDSMSNILSMTYRFEREIVIIPESYDDITELWSVESILLKYED